MTKILVIDDDPEMRETMVHILEDEGHEVIVADDGCTGLVEYQAQAPDLVITDIFMPNKEGIETIREILALRPDAKIIATSGGARIGRDFYLRSAQKLGALDVLSKPFEIEELIRRVNICLDGGRPRPSPR